MQIPSALVQYKSKDYKEINDFLKSGKLPAFTSQEKMENKVKMISDIMKQGMPPTASDGCLYRGTNILEFSVRTVDLLQRKVGTTHTWKQFVSTSVEKYIARKFTKAQDGVLIQITPNEHTRFYDMSNASLQQKIYLKHINNEREVLLDHKTRCRITEVRPNITAHCKKYTLVIVKLL